MNEYTVSQEKAINWNDGPVAVIAGPGSGKTMVLTERIKRLLAESKNETFRILALTFTNKAAQEMTERILGKEGLSSPRLYIGTFHSFCSSVMRSHGVNVGVKSNFDIYTSDKDIKYVIDEICEDCSDKLGDFPSSDLNLLTVIRYFEKRLCYTDAEIDKCMPETRFAREYKLIYSEYISRMNRDGLLDFDMLIMMTYRLFKEYPFIAKAYARTYRYINVDEFQDTNYGQYMVLSSMCRDTNKNIFLLADEDQIIYTWNGADYRHILRFEKEYNACRIELNQNFRCPEEVINVANRIISCNNIKGFPKKDLKAIKINTDNSKNIYVYEFSSYENEVVGISKIINKIKADSPEESIAVIARSNRFLERTFEEINKLGIDCQYIKRKNEFQSPFILWVYLILKLANHRNDKRILKEIEHILDIHLNIKIDSNIIIFEADITDGDLLKAFRNHCEGLFRDNEFEKSLRYNLIEGKNFMRFIEDAFRWNEKQINLIQDDSMKEQINEDYNMEKEIWESFNNRMKMKYINMDEVYLSTYVQDISMSSKGDIPRDDAVQFLTVHASKGKEFDHVIVMGMVDNEFPSYHSLRQSNRECLEEERRNFFVAITRTKKRLYLTYSLVYDKWKREKSIFLDEGKLLEYKSDIENDIVMVN